MRNYRYVLRNRIVWSLILLILALSLIGCSDAITQVDASAVQVAREAQQVPPMEALSAARPTDVVHTVHIIYEPAEWIPQEFIRGFPLGEDIYIIQDEDGSWTSFDYERSKLVSTFSDFLTFEIAPGYTREQFNEDLKAQTGSGCVVESAEASSQISDCSRLPMDLTVKVPIDMVYCSPLKSGPWGEALEISCELDGVEVQLGQTSTTMLVTTAPVEEQMLNDFNGLLDAHQCYNAIPMELLTVEVNVPYLVFGTCTQYP